jgi:hypothetical protein
LRWPGRWPTAATPWPLGALLRSPLVGLSETELLDIAEALTQAPVRPDHLRQLNLWTDPHEISHGLAREVLEILQSLSCRARSTTPYVLLSGAVALLKVRPHLRLRHRSGAERALANVDLFLETSRAYDVRGLRAFGADMRANWESRPERADQKSGPVRPATLRLSGWTLCNLTANGA